ncbi:c-type cytochrome [Desulfuromonas versatilis]|uniref:C-type cytochrome n=1 Tax=Desulfuromonas versatilis TaxID=2802975 RepID=A0ABM8I1S3_9BACT|nr:cytochrome-c peroxidase [Desulfuromonas versatilis]BCR06943.1 c-type cytochrome [Desulfuromonas versatilis]
MRGRILAVMTGVVLIAASAWSETDLLTRAQGMFKPLPTSPPALKDNPASPEKVELGRMLYFEPRLSASGLISCQTCHNVGLAGVDLQETSVGHGWQKGPRNAPTTFNAVFNTAQFWDGRAKDLAEQAKGPVQASVEMNNTPEQVVATLKSLPEYVAVFKKVFAKEAEPVTFDNMAMAIEAFEATLITPNAPFDRYLRGDAKALSASQLEGLGLFMNKGCGSCHNGVNVGGNGYFPFGVVENPGGEILPKDDPGRFKVTNTASDQYVFRSPSLRNVALSPPYFHSGKVWSLRDAVTIMGSAQLGIKLDQGQIDHLAEFLDALTGEQPQVLHPVLPAQRIATPRPELGS